MKIGDWVVYHESTSYWDVGEVVGWQGEDITYELVCRVKKHSLGKENLNKILAVRNYRIVLDAIQMLCQGAAIETLAAVAQLSVTVIDVDRALKARQPARVSDTDH